MTEGLGFSESQVGESVSESQERSRAEDGLCCRVDDVCNGWEEARRVARWLEEEVYLWRAWESTKEPRPAHIRLLSPMSTCVNEEEYLCLRKKSMTKTRVPAPRGGDLP